MSSFLTHLFPPLHFPLFTFSQDACVWLWTMQERALQQIQQSRDARAHMGEERKLRQLRSMWTNQLFRVLLKMSVQSMASQRRHSKCSYRQGLRTLQSRSLGISGRNPWIG